MYDEFEWKWSCFGINAFYFIVGMRKTVKIVDMSVLYLQDKKL